MNDEDSEFFKKNFPHLYEEIKNRTKSISVDGVRTSSKEGEKASKSGESPLPNVLDYIRLCEDEDEAIEIIDYMEDEEKIDSEYATKIKTQLVKQGLRSFGSKRKPGEYKELQNSE